MKGKDKNVTAVKTKLKKMFSDNQESAKDVIIRTWRVIVASSIIYAIVVIAMGTEDTVPKILIIPAGLYSIFLLIKR